MALTTILEKNSASDESNFDDIEVLAALIRASLPSSSTLIDKFDWMNLTDSLNAILYPLIIAVGWILFLTSSLAPLRSSAARMTTEVVPSPTSLS